MSNDAYSDNICNIVQIHISFGRSIASTNSLVLVNGWYSVYCPQDYETTRDAAKAQKLINGIDPESEEWISSRQVMLGEAKNNSDGT